MSKSFKQPADVLLQQLSQEEQTPVEARPEEVPPVKEEGAPVITKAIKPPLGYKINHEFVETKSRRLQVLLQPSVYEGVKKAAGEAGVSVNEYINSVLRISV